MRGRFHGRLLVRLDSGLTLHYLLRNLQARDPRSLEVCALLTKPDRRRVELPIRYVGFEIPDRFAIGYGLDYAQRYRNLGARDPRSLEVCALLTKPERRRGCGADSGGSVPSR